MSPGQINDEVRNIIIKTKAKYSPELEKAIADILVKVYNAGHYHGMFDKEVELTK